MNITAIITAVVVVAGLGLLLGLFLVQRVSGSR